MNDSRQPPAAHATEETSFSPSSHNLRRIVARVAHGALASCGVAYIAGAGARLHWGLELFTHFTMQLALVTFVVALTLAALKQWKGLAWVALLLAGLLWRLAPWSAQVTPWVDTQSPTLRLVSANIRVQARDFSRLTQFIREVDAEVIVLQELSAHGLQRLETALTDFPHRHVVLRNDAFGIGVFSRRPLTDLDIKHWSPQLPSLVCRFLWGGKNVCLIATHPLPPVSRRHSQLRNGQLEKLARAAAGIEGPLVVIGDLNCTPWSPYFRDLLRGGDLRDTRGRQLHATWPAAFPWPARIPLDHALVSRHWVVRSRQQGPRCQSDHLPVSVELALQQ